MADEVLDQECQAACARFDERLTALDARLSASNAHSQAQREALVHSFQQLLDEREKRFIERLAAEERNRALDIKSLETRLLDAMTASDKAIVKAEEAQREYNARSNEFRGQINDQQKTLMSRSESHSQFKSVDKRLNALHAAIEDKIRVLQQTVEKTIERNREDIITLRESRSEVSGRRVGNNELIAVIVGIALVLSTLFIAVVPAVLHHSP